MDKKSLRPDFKKEVENILSELKNSIYDLYDIATKDEKTGIYNHRFFRVVFEMELEKAKRKKQKLSLAIIDIDFFKKFNDTYGHLVGDEIILELAKTLQNETRKYDLVSRFGGEEFFILFPHTDLKKSRIVLKRLKANLWKNSKLKKYKINISVGFTEYKGKDTMDKMIKRADDALYLSKKNGRNMISWK